MIVGFLLVLALIHILLLAVVVQLLRRRRFHFLLVAVAVYAWALGLWSGAAATVAPVRTVLGGSQTFDDFDLGVQLIFVGLALVVVVAAWRRVQAARAATQLPATPTVVVTEAPPALPAPPVDADAWLR